MQMRVKERVQKLLFQVVAKAYLETVPKLMMFYNDAPGIYQ
jgi:hypothetical protein